MKRGIDFVEAHLHEEIALVDVSRAAGVSHWHFQRMFKALTNETLKSYVRSRRLAQARVDLQKLRIDEDYIRHLRRDVSLEPEIGFRRARHMVGSPTRFFSVDSELNNIAEKLPPLWEAFMPRVSEVARRLEGRCYGVIRQAAPDSELLEYVAAVEVPEPPAPSSVPQGMTYEYVGEATYATFTHRGRSINLDQTVSYIYSNWLFHSGLRHSYGPDLEIYDHWWRDESDDSVMEYAIPLDDSR